MKIYHTLNRDVLHNKEFPMDSVILTLSNKVQLVCTDFNHPRKEKLCLYIWLPSKNRWAKTYAKNEYTELMWQYHRKHQRKRKSHINYEVLMRHDRRHKSGGGGARLSNNEVITDYECSKNPLHDFRRCYN